MKKEKIRKKVKIAFEPCWLKEELILKAYEVIVPIFSKVNPDQNNKNDLVEDNENGKKNRQKH